MKAFLLHRAKDLGAVDLPQPIAGPGALPELRDVKDACKSRQGAEDCINSSLGAVDVYPGQP